MALQFSNTKHLGVTITEANPDTGWYVEAYDKYNVTKKLAGFNVITAFFKPVMNSIGTGYIDVPVDDAGIPTIISATGTKETSLLHVYLDGLFRYAFFADKLSLVYDEEGNAEAARIQGMGMEAVADRSVMGNADFPNSPSLTPNWGYGSTENFLRNPSFESSLEVLKNPGGEDGNDDDGNVNGWNKFGDNTASVAVFDNANARTDQWYISVATTGNHAGIRQTVTVVPNKVYHVRAHVKDPTAAGMRVTMSLSGANDIAAIGVSYPNNYAYKGGIYAELGNVPQNALKNGLPGGATDGSWQVMDVEVKTGDEQTSLEISIQDDHHGTPGVHTAFWVDDVEIEGWLLGLAPWKSFDDAAHASNSLRLDTSHAYDSSSHSLRINPLERFAGFEQEVALNPGTTYTASIYGLSETTISGDFWKLEAIDKNSGDFLGYTADTTAGTDGAWKNWSVVFVAPESDEAVDVIIRFVYSGSNNPNPFFLDSASLVPGEPKATAGKILNDVLGTIQSRSELTFLQTSFTETVDSKGYNWPAELAMDIEPSETLFGVLDRLVALGHEWNIVPVNFAEGGNTGFMLNVYTSRPLNSNSGVGTNWEGNVIAPVIMPSDATIGGRLSSNVNLPNTVYVASENGLWSVAYQEDLASYLNAFGQMSEYITANSGVDQTTLSKYAEARLAELRYKESIVQLNMQRSSVLRPFLSFGIGDSVSVDIEPYFEYGTFHRVRSIATTLAGEGADITYVVDFSQVLYEDSAALFAKIAQLSERAPADISSQGGGSAASSSGSVSGSTTSPTTIGVHEHEFDGTEITNKALSGDASGTLPGPVTVNAVKGVPFDSDVPADDDREVLLRYDRDSKTIVMGQTEMELGDLADGDVTTKVHGLYTRYKNDVITNGFTTEPEPTITSFSQYTTLEPRFAWPGVGNVHSTAVWGVDTEFWQCEFPTDQKFAGFKFDNSHGTLYVTELTVQTSDDGVNWVDVKAVTGLVSNNEELIRWDDLAADDLPFGRYWRLRWDAKASTRVEVDEIQWIDALVLQGYDNVAHDVDLDSLTDVELGTPAADDGKFLGYLDPLGLQGAEYTGTDPTISAECQYTSYAPINAYRDNAGVWVTCDGNVGQTVWWQADFGVAGYEVGAVSFYTPHASLYPDEAWVEYSDDGVIWSSDQLGFIDSIDGTADPYTLEFSYRGTHRYWRLYTNRRVSRHEIDQIRFYASGEHGWKPRAAAVSVLTTKGDLVTYDTDDARLPVGTDDQVLTADSAASLGVKWATPAAAGGGGDAPVSAEMRLTANLSIADVTWVDIDWDAEEYDDDSYWEGVTNPERITFPSAGKYLVTVNAIFATNTTGDRYIRALRNGNTAKEIAVVSQPAVAAETRLSLTFVVNAAIDDYVTVQAYQDSTAALNLIGSGSVGDDAEVTRVWVSQLSSAASASVPQWLTDLAVRPTSGHAYDDEFDDDSLHTDWATVNITGTIVAAEGAGRLSLKSNGGGANDFMGILKDLDSLSYPLTIETAAQAMSDGAGGSGMVGIGFTDGVATTSNLFFIRAWETGNLGSMYGTLTDVDSSNNAAVILSRNSRFGFLYMRVIWSAANTFKSQFSVDGVTWTGFGTTTMSKTITPTKFGLCLLDWSSTEDVLASYEYFRVTESDLSL